MAFTDERAWRIESVDGLAQRPWLKWPWRSRRLGSNRDGKKSSFSGNAGKTPGFRVSRIRPCGETARNNGVTDSPSARKRFVQARAAATPRNIYASKARSYHSAMATPTSRIHVDMVIMKTGACPLTRSASETYLSSARYRPGGR